MLEKKQEKLVLSIDTTDNLKTIVKLGKTKIIEKYKSPREQKLLILIKQALEKTNTSLKEIREIKVNTGPGSFTGIRVGVSVANALAWSLGIKVNGKEMAVPVYQKN